MSKLEKTACKPVTLNTNGFNPCVEIPYGLTPKQIRSAMDEFLDFLGFINIQLHSKGIERLESFMMPANFSSMVGEFMGSSLPKHCKKIVRNKYHNGHPDMLPRGLVPGDSILHGSEGIEIKSSRHMRGWQGHNPEMFG